MIRVRLLTPLLVLALGCVQAPVVGPIVDDSATSNQATTFPVPPPVRATRVDGGLRLQGVAGQKLIDGQLLIVGGGFRMPIFRSPNDGVSFLPLRAPEVAGLTPDIALIDGRPAIAYAAFHVEGDRRMMDGIRLLRTHHEDGRWLDPRSVVVAETGVDPHLLPLATGRVLCFAVIRGTSLGVFASDDDGRSWFPIGQPVRNADTRLEDLRATLLPDGTILLAFEREPEENGPSTIASMRSTDGGLTWSSPKTLWRPSMPADVEPGGFVQHANGALLFFVSSDEEPANVRTSTAETSLVGTSYPGARVHALVSHDLGETWTMSGTIIDEPNQVVFHVFPRAAGGLGLLTVRHWQEGHRALAVYHLNADDVARLVALP